MVPHILRLTLVCCLQALTLSAQPSALNNSVVLDDVHVSRGLKVECDAQRFGDGLAANSCGNAWAKIGRNVQPRIFAQRPQHQGEVALPIRFLSGTFRELILTPDVFRSIEFAVG
ncbi:MAG: hypothetical protein Q9225_007350 [Loekoesia sp. 1 TL-2023]